MKRLLIVIPAFNEEKSIGKVINSLSIKIKEISKIDLLVVDDGSKDDTTRIALKTHARLLRHIINRGLGSALATGFKYALLKDYDFVITFDADGQHRAKDITRILEPLISGRADVVIGSRLKNPGRMPMARKLVNIFSNLLTFFLFNIWTTDSQSGLRGFNKAALKKIKIRSQRMEVSSEIFKEISRLNLRLTEVPIETIYTNYSLSKGQPITNAPNVFWRLIFSRFS